jgi:hypothetical protein
MDLSFGPEHVNFRDEIRRFLSHHWGQSRSADAASVAAFRVRATDHGYLYRWVPWRYGGSEQPSDPIRARIVVEEFAAARAPGELHSSVVRMLVPTLLERGRENQRLQEAHLECGSRRGVDRFRPARQPDRRCPRARVPRRLYPPF